MNSFLNMKGCFSNNINGNQEPIKFDGLLRKFDSITEKR